MREKFPDLCIFNFIFPRIISLFKIDSSCFLIPGELIIPIAIYQGKKTLSNDNKIVHFFFFREFHDFFFFCEHVNTFFSLLKVEGTLQEC